MQNHENKSRSVTLRFTQKSYGALKEKATRSHVTLSNYLRNRIATGSYSSQMSNLQSRLLTSEEKRNATCSKIRRATGNVGNDLNQAMRAVNTHVLAGVPGSLESVKKAIYTTQKQLKNVTVEISKIERKR